MIVLAVFVAVAADAAMAATPPKPKLSASRAKSIAAKKMNGVAKSAKYEFEDGRWQYAVIVTKGAEMYEVEVDPTTGKVLDSEKTSAAAEAKEEAADKAKAAGKTHPKADAEKDEKGEKGEKGEGK